MNKYKIIYHSQFKDAIESYDSIAEAVSDYKALCSCSTLSTCTITLLKNDRIINQAKFTDLEVE